MKQILFLGDSITDCDHCFTPDNLGNGYVKMISDHLAKNHTLHEEPYHIVNGGTDGFTFPSICRKWKQSYSSQTFDTVSILGGINDTGMLMESGMSEAQIQVQIMHSGLALRNLLDGLIRQKTPDILLLEPFLFPHPEHLRTWMGRLEQIRRMIRQNVRSYSAAPALTSEHTDRTSSLHLISLQSLLDPYAQEHGYDTVTTDGIHLTAAGHQILCEGILPLIT